MPHWWCAGTRRTSLARVPGPGLSVSLRQASSVAGERARHARARRYYQRHECRRPRLFFKEGSPIAQQVLAACPLLSAPYRPTFWACNPHVQTLLSVLRKLTLRAAYRRHLLPAPDGCVLSRLSCLPRRMRWPALPRAGGLRTCSHVAHYADHPRSLFTLHAHGRPPALAQGDLVLVTALEDTCARTLALRRTHWATRPL